MQKNHNDVYVAAPHQSGRTMRKRPLASVDVEGIVGNFMLEVFDKRSQDIDFSASPIDIPFPRS